MSSGCGDVLSLVDLQTAKKHQIFEAEVITGKSGGVAGGADIDYATNQVTGQTQKTLPAVLRDAGFFPVSWDFSTGGTLTVNDRGKVVYDPVSKTWYSYAGTLPVTVPAGFNPVGNADWKPQTDPYLREQLEGSVLDPTTSTTFGALTRDVEFFGAIGDGVTDDTSAWLAAAAWVTGGNYRHITTRDGKIYRISSTVNFNFANGRGHSILMKSPIRPDDGTGIAFLIQNTRNSVFDLKVDGGGGALVDYSQPDPVGAQTAFYIRGVRECDINVNGVSYLGRVLRTNGLDAATGGTIKMSFNTLSINTGDRAGAALQSRCGQAYYLQGDSSAWGKIQTAWIQWDSYGSVHDGLTDFTVDNIEFGSDQIGGLKFLGIRTAHINTISGGDETNTNTVVYFGPTASGQHCQGVHVNRIFSTYGTIGVEFNGNPSSSTTGEFFVESITTTNNTNCGIRVNNCSSSYFGLYSTGDAVGIKLAGVCRNVRFRNIHIQSSFSAVLAEEGANIGNIYFEGRIIGNTDAVNVDLSLAIVGKVDFDKVMCTAPSGAYSIPVANVVSVRNGAIDLSGTGTAFPLGTAKVVINNDGFVTRNRGAESISAGNQTITISHGLAQQPTEISITPLSTAGAFRVLNIGATTFDVRLPAVASGTAWTFIWFASCEYH